MSAPGSSGRLSTIRVGDSLPEREFRPDIRQSMLYNAVLFNAHRIHYEDAYARDVEGYPGMVLPGPMLGDWLHQCLEEWLGEDGHIASIEYSNRVATYVDEALVSGGTVTAVDVDGGTATVDVFVRNAEGEVATPGTAQVRFTDA